MKKYVVLLLPSLFFIGCASKNLDTCEAKKTLCETQCKINNPDKGFKYKACKAKCFATYSKCKIKKKVKELTK